MKKIKRVKLKDLKAGKFYIRLYGLHEGKITYTVLRVKGRPFQTNVILPCKQKIKTALYTPYRSSFSVYGLEYFLSDLGVDEFSHPGVGLYEYNQKIINWINGLTFRGKPIDNQDFFAKVSGFSRLNPYPWIKVPSE